MTETIWLLALACLAFLLTHMIPPISVVRGGLIGRLGKGGYLILYNVVSILTLGWMIWAYVEAPVVRLWSPPGWSGTVALVINAVAFIFMAGGYMTYNPTALMSNLKGAYDGDRPLGAIFKITRHPVMWAAAMLSATHMLVTGTAAPAIFFATLLIVALGGAWHIDQRKAVEWGARWEILERQTSFFPFVALLTGKTSTADDEIDLKPIIVGLALFAVFVYGHSFLFGKAITP